MPHGQQVSDRERPSSAAVGRRPLVLAVGSLPPALFDLLSEEFTLVGLPDRNREDFLASRGDEFTAAVTTGVTGVDGSTLRSLRRLAAVVSLGVGYDSTDVETARELGVAVANTPDVLTDCVADLAVGMVIDVVRGMTAADRYVRQGKWPDAPMPLARDVRGKRVGIIGLGRIGQAVADRLAPFSVRLGYHNRRSLPDVAHPYFDSPEALADWSDILVVAATGGRGSQGLVSHEVLARLGPEGYLVNVSRGSVVDQDALIDALRRGILAGAALDVFADEPHVPQALMNLENVVLLPHIGSATVETRAAMAHLVRDNLRSFFSSGRVLTPV